MISSEAHQETRVKERRGWIWGKSRRLAVVAPNPRWMSQNQTQRFADVSEPDPKVSFSEPGPKGVRMSQNQSQEFADVSEPDPKVSLMAQVAATHQPTRTVLTNPLVILTDELTP